MVLVTIKYLGEDLTEGKGVLVPMDKVRELEGNGFVLELVK